MHCVCMYKSWQYVHHAYWAKKDKEHALHGMDQNLLIMWESYGGILMFNNKNIVALYTQKRAIVQHGRGNKGGILTTIMAWHVQSMGIVVIEHMERTRKQVWCNKVSIIKMVKTKHVQSIIVLVRSPM